MSDLGAVEKGGAAETAWHYRALFLDHGTIYKAFFCPFCGIHLSARLIYEKGECSRAPHFVASKGRHLYSCDGAPILLNERKRTPQKSHLIPHDTRFPEALVKRVPPSITKILTGDNIHEGDMTESEVLLRRKSFSTPSEARTCSIKSIVETYNLILYNGCNWAKENGIISSEQWKHINDTLSKIPLRLDDKTNYEDAFRTPRRIDKLRRRIYHGKGIICESESGYEIKSSIESRHGERPVNFSVVIWHGIVDAKSPQPHRSGMKWLEGECKQRTEVRWYAYGIPNFLGEKFTINVASMDHLYVKAVHQ